MKPKAPDMAGLATPRKLSLWTWAIGAFGAAALHAGGVAFAVTQMNAADDNVDDGAPAIEIALEPASARTEPTELPPGPEAEASTASPAVAEQKAKAEENALPKAEPIEDEQPERLVAPEAPVKPPEKEPEVKAVPANASSESIASEASAAPTYETPQESTRAAAPVQGTGASAQRLRATWQRQLLAHFDRNKRYPVNAAQLNAEIILTFTLDRRGRVLSSNVVRGSGNAAFDDAALAMMKRSDPVPQPPPVVADEGLTFTLPVIFRVKGRS